MHGRPPHLPAKADYAVRALLLLAERAPELVKLGELSADQALPRKFTEGILRELQRHGFVRSRRGSTCPTSGPRWTPACGRSWT